MKIELNNDEIDVLLDLSLEITGIQSHPNQIKSFVIENVKQRMILTENFELNHYLNFLDNNQEEYDKFLSAITVHTTGWFREFEHFRILENEIINLIQNHNIQFIRILSIPCSTGEEVYSLAFLLETITEKFPHINYNIIGIDIDSQSIKKSKNAVYCKDDLQNIPLQFHKYILNGSGNVKEFFAIKREIRDHCQFFEGDIRDDNFLKNNISFNNSLDKNDHFNIILCRNLFIYFKQNDIDKIISNFKLITDENGIICIGHSEKIEADKFKLFHIGNSIYKKNLSPIKINSENLNIDFLLFSNSDPIRLKNFSDRFSKEFKDFKLINSLDQLKSIEDNNQLKVVAIDRDSKSHELIQLLLTIVKKNKNIFVIETIIFPSQKLSYSLDIYHESQIFKDFQDWRSFDINTSQIILYLKKLLNSIETPGTEQKENNKAIDKNKKVKVFIDNLIPDFIAIGASTGGTVALVELLKNIPNKFPPIIIVQHLPHIFSKEFIEKLKKTSGLKYVSPMERPLLKHGHIYLADGDNHIIVKGSTGNYRVEPDMSPPKKDLRPCVDILFDSIAKTKAKGIGILLTGMGNDGAHGLLKLKQNGCLTITQNEESCVIYGMPKEAEALDASCFSGDLFEIRQLLNKMKTKVS